MENLIENIQIEQALIVLAPPGWGKTYKTLCSLKTSKRKCLFIFPLRALCDEVFFSATKMGINVCNIHKVSDFNSAELDFFQLIVTTPECLNIKIIEALSEEYLFILDEAHLIYYWGTSFRPKMLDVFDCVKAFSPALILLSATFSQHNIEFTSKKLDLDYKEVVKVDIGNLKLKNFPSNYFFYFKQKKKWVLDEIQYGHKDGCSLVFCRYRSEVLELSTYFTQKGFQVLSCVGGETRDFTMKLQSGFVPQIIIATCVLGHGVNLPDINKVFFLYKVKELEFYLQMIGRAGRTGGGFEVHTMNLNYFGKRNLMWGAVRVFIKRVRNRAKSLLYWSDAS